MAVLLSDPASMITGILAAWKAGKLCVPLDAALPPARLEVILRDSEAGLVVTDRDGRAALPPLPGASSRQLLFDAVDLRAAVEPPDEVVERRPREVEATSEASVAAHVVNRNGAGNGAPGNVARRQIQVELLVLKRNIEARVLHVQLVGKRQAHRGHRELATDCAIDRRDEWRL